MASTWQSNQHIPSRHRNNRKTPTLPPLFTSQHSHQPHHEMTKIKKHLSSIANDVLQRCAQKLDTTVDAMVEEFEAGLKPEIKGYSRKLVEFCCSKSLSEMCCNIDETIGDGSFSRFTFDMMLAWETPTSTDEESYTVRSVVPSFQKTRVDCALYEQ